jgi:hypothetical protein
MVYFKKLQRNTYEELNYAFSFYCRLSLAFQTHCIIQTSIVVLLWKRCWLCGAHKRREICPQHLVTFCEDKRECVLILWSGAPLKAQPKTYCIVTEWGYFGLLEKMSWMLLRMKRMLSNYCVKNCNRITFSRSSLLCDCVYVCSLHLQDKTKFMSLTNVRKVCVVKHEMVSEQN